MRSNQRRTLLKFIFVVLSALGLVVCVGYTANAWNVSDGNTSISRVRINGGGSDVTVAPGSTVTVSLHFVTSNVGCPGCDQQIEVGFGHLVPTQCIFDRSLGGMTFSKHKTFTLTAPAEPGSYFVAYDTADDIGCFRGGQDWWVNPLDPTKNYLGHITVQ
jgi:hypothetical protein